MKSLRLALATLLLPAAVALALPAKADDSAQITIRNHKFEPSTLTVKAGVKIKLTVTNAQAEAAEFESNELNREKVIPPGASATIYIGPLEPGSYGFFDDFHASTTGRIVAK